MNMNIETRFDKKLDATARASADILAWQIGVADAVVDITTKEYGEVSALGLRGIVSEKAATIVADLRNGNTPVTPYPMGEEVLADALKGPLGHKLANLIGNSVFKQATGVILKARRLASQSLDEAILKYEQGERAAHIYDHPELEVKKEERTTDPATEIARREKSLAAYPARKGKK
jgi:hypothetical protein